MSRVIKFRVWDDTLKNYEDAVDSSGFRNEYELFLPARELLPASLELLNEPERYVVEQFTGLTDKNGKDIYEGDIVKAQGMYGWVSHGIVEWGEYGDNEYVEHLETWMIAWMGKTDREKDYVERNWLTPLSCAVKSCGVRFSRGLSLTPNSLCVIGNIHENPELLRDETQGT